MNFMELLHKDPSSEQGPVRYLDGSKLKRPFDPPRFIDITCAIVAAAALIIGGVMAFKAIDHILHSEERAAAAVEQNISRDVTYDIPVMQDYMTMDDATLLATFQEAGFVTYDISSSSGSGLDIMKLPSDTSLADAGITLAAGINTLDAETASKYLVGSWRLTTDRSDGASMRIRYSDMKATNAQEAIQSAMEGQGWADNPSVEISEEGEDAVGNTFKEGTVETDSGTYAWRVSACALTAVYDISGLPAAAQYVGIRIWEQQ